MLAKDSPHPLCSCCPKTSTNSLALTRKLTLDNEALQKRFYELSRHWHPDRFSRKSAAEQAQALEATAILNDGYRTLRDPVKRAEYLLKEEGFPIGEQRSKDVPPELLEEVFELNMALEELKGGEESARPQLEAAKENFVESARRHRPRTGIVVCEIRRGGTAKRDRQAGPARDSRRY